MPRPRAAAQLAVKLQSIEDLVDHLTLGAHCESDQIEFSADHRPHRFAVGRIMRRLEHVLGVDRRLHASR